MVLMSLNLLAKVSPWVAVVVVPNRLDYVLLIIVPRVFPRLLSKALDVVALLV